MAQINRFIFSLSKFGIGCLERFFKASVQVHGQEQLPDGVIIFVVNHFTRLETLVLPYEFYRITGKPLMSLAHHGFFTGALGDYLERMGAVSTRDPNRDKVIIRSLLKGDHPWLIFPEGSMIKDKKVLERGRFAAASPTGLRRSLHTGAAVFALRTEFYRQRIHHLHAVAPDLLAEQLQCFDLESAEQVSRKETYLVPVNVTYYPLRSRQNALETLASYLVKDLPARVREELETEGTMLLSGVDMDICFGQPLAIRPRLNHPHIQEDIQASRRILPDEPIPSRPLLRTVAEGLTTQAMAAIYRMTAVNFDHLAAYVLKYYPWRRISRFDLMERLNVAVEEVCQLDGIRFHAALQKNRPARLLREDQAMLSDFLDIAQRSGAIELLGEMIVKKPLRPSPQPSFETIRREHPYLVILNEIECLRAVMRRLRRVAWRPGWQIRRHRQRQLRALDRQQFAADYAASCVAGESKPRSVGAPFLLKRRWANTGVLLIHGYLAAPEEVRLLGEFLHRHGFTVYGCRLPGHGTSPDDLARRTWQEWLGAVERGYLILANSCREVVIGGFSCGAGLALYAGSENLAGVKAVFAVNPPAQLRRKAARLAPAVVLWSKLVERISREETRPYFVPNDPENPDINYTRNPVSGVKELMELMENVSDRLASFTLPVLVIQGSDDPVVDPEGSRKLYMELGSQDKEFTVYPADRHVIIRREGAERIFSRILAFIQSRR